MRELLLGAVEGDARYLSDPTPRVVVTALNDCNVSMEFQVWLEEERNHVSARCELRKKCFEALRGAGVDLPFETIEVRSRRAAA